ncbi:MAG: hypothetical protein ACREIL_04665, partial [Nitrospiraceae bacterium]
MPHTIKKALGLVTRLAFNPDHWKCLLQALPVERDILAPDEILERLALAANWIADAQDSQTNGGISAGYYLYQGWRSAYPETTGYITRTFIDYGSLTQRSDIFDRAHRMCRFLLDVQEPAEGWFPGGDLSSRRAPSVFNSGMVLH